MMLDDDNDELLHFDRLKRYYRKRKIYLKLSNLWAKYVINYSLMSGCSCWTSYEYDYNTCVGFLS